MKTRRRNGWGGRGGRRVAGGRSRRLPATFLALAFGIVFGLLGGLALWRFQLFGPPLAARSAPMASTEVEARSAGRPLRSARAVNADAADANSGAGPAVPPSPDNTRSPSIVSEKPAQPSSQAQRPAGTSRDGASPKAASRTACFEATGFSKDTLAGAALGFDRWLAAFKRDARDMGIAADVLDRAFRGIQPIPKVVELDRRQSEYALTFRKYLQNNISPQRIARGKAFMRQHAALLKKIRKRYGVQPRFLLALWAMESNFGRNTGGFSTIGALVTLAYEGRRADFFRKELMCALHILAEGHVTVEAMKGSWAGAMGQPQFMPSTFIRYATDGDGDGRYDIWRNTADVLASAANYLHRIGWDRHHTWGREVRLPDDFDPYLASYSTWKWISEWQSLGVRAADGGDLPVGVRIKGAILLPSGIDGPAFLVYDNFKALREWNHSLSYALTVAHLSDRFRRDDPGPIRARGPKNERPLGRAEAMAMQKTLGALGFYDGKVDGMVGLKTRAALREYQRSRGLVADAYPSASTLARLKTEIDKDADGGDAATDTGRVQ